MQIYINKKRYANKLSNFRNFFHRINIIYVKKIV
jgi:hypothetical protein